MATTENTNYWKPREVAEYFRVSPSAVMAWIHQQKISALLLPCKRYLIPAEEVERIKNSTYLPCAMESACEVGARIADRKAREAAALARLREFKEQQRKDRKNERNRNN